MRYVLPTVHCMLVLAACSSAPKLSTVNESQKRPVNAPMAVELQVCRNDLHNTRLLATESGRLADTTSATLAYMNARQQILLATQGPTGQNREGSSANSVFTVRFEFGSTRVVIPADLATPLIEGARAAPLVLLRGRTDGTSDALAESRVAKDRAGAVRDYLVAAGVDPARIRTTYQPSGDYVADNTSTGGRGLNRRVEIELYRTLPIATTSSRAITVPRP